MTMQPVRPISEAFKQLDEMNIPADQRKKAHKYLEAYQPSICLDLEIPPDFSNRSTTYFGGMPSLPSIEDWPITRYGKPAVFIAQLDCKEITNTLPGYYPETGIMCFFVDPLVYEGDELDPKIEYVKYFDIPSDTPPLEALPNGYDTTESFFSKELKFDSGHIRNYPSDSIEFKTLPRIDVSLKRHDSLPCWYHWTENLSDNEDINTDIFKRLFDDQEVATELPLNEHDDLYFNILPIPGAVIDYPEWRREARPRKYFDSSDYPWSRMHLSSLLINLIPHCPFSCRRLINVEPVLEKFDLTEDHQKSYVPPYSPFSGRAEPTFTPIFLNHPLLDEMKQWASEQSEELEQKLLLAIEYELLIQEALTWLARYSDSPYENLTNIEKLEFNRWFAGWINGYAAMMDSPEDYLLPAGQDWESIAMRSFENPHYKRAIPILSEIDRAGIRSFSPPSMYCALHSEETAKQIPPEVRSWLKHRVKDSAHRVLGAPENVQSAMEDNAGKILLFQQSYDDRLMNEAKGECNLQYWISPEDLKAKRFDRVNITAECT